MASMAIIGTERCGKTVLVTTLAMRFQSPDERGIFIEPVSRKTKTYVDRSWSRLNNCDWPDTTAPGELNELSWRMHAGDGVSCDVRLVDCAGHDLRALFADEQINERDKLPDALQKVADYCRTADIVLFVANLSDFLSEENADRLIANQWAVKFGMDQVRHNCRQRHCCLLFTQVDLYDQLRQECEDWVGVAKKYLPNVYAAHLHDATVPVFPVAAVADTTEKQSGGDRRVVPRVGFTSRGFEPLVEWLATAVRDVSKRRAAEEAEQRRVEQEKQRAAAAEKERQRRQAASDKLEVERKLRRERLVRLCLDVGPWGAAAAILVYFLALYPCLGVGRWIQPLIEERKEVRDLIEVATYAEVPNYVTKTEPDWIFWTRETVVQDGTRLELQKTEFLPPEEAPKPDGKFVRHKGVKHMEKVENKVVGVRNMWFWSFVLPLFLAISSGLALSSYLWGRRVQAGA